MAFNPFDLTGKVGLITGGNGGIGLGMAEGLAAAGARVAVWGQNPDKNAKAEETLKAYGVDVLVQKVDVADEAAVVAAVAEVLAKFGRIDFCAANAGLGGGARVWCVACLRMCRSRRPTPGSSMGIRAWAWRRAIMPRSSGHCCAGWQRRNTIC